MIPHGSRATAAAMAVLACACTGEGSVEIRFLLPDVAELSPTELQLAQVTVVTEVPGEARRSETRQIASPDEAIDMGTIPVGEEVSIAVELRSPTQRLIGFGRSPGPIDIAPDTVTEVPIMLRRPFAYVTGGDGIATFDAALDAAFPYQGHIEMTPRPAAVAATHAGGELVVVTARGGDGELRIVSTSDHRASDAPPIALPAPPSCVTLSPDDQYAVIGHAGAGGGVSVVRMDEARAGSGSAVFAPLGSVEAVAVRSVDVNLVFALVDRSEADSCSPTPPASRVVGVSLRDPTLTAMVIDHGAAIHDIALDPETGVLAVADYCNRQIVTYDTLGDVNVATQALFVTYPGAVAILDGRIWSVGTSPALGDEGARLTLASINLDGSGESRLNLPGQEERARAQEFSSTGQAAEIRMNADTLRAADLALVPGGDHVALLHHALYHADETGDFLGQPIIPNMNLEAYEFMLVNASTGIPVQRVRTFCELIWERDPLNPPFLDAWDCSQAPGQDVVPYADRYVPIELDVLYGAK